MGDVVKFDGVTRLPRNPDDVIAEASDEGLTTVIILGYDADGDEYFASSDADGGSVIWQMERAKLKLLRVVDDV